jgi:homoserine dehydrogenase
LPTASAVVSDVIYAATHTDIKYSTFKNNATADADVKFVSDFESAYYLRLSVSDKAGALAKISGMFAKHGVSIVKVSQLPKDDAENNDEVTLIIVTHKTTENSVKNVVAKINASELGTVDSVIRVEQ